MNDIFYVNYIVDKNFQYSTHNESEWERQRFGNYLYYQMY